MRLTTILSNALVALSLMAGVAAPAHAQTQIAKPDSVQGTALGALPASNCPNIQTQWYAAGQVPSGYYKQGVSPFHCLPIPACASNQSFDQATATCGCAAGTIWDGAYGTCHAPCASGTAWNGSACVNTCPAGTAWNGSSCASICSAGTTWNGSSCVSVCAAGTSWNGTSCQSICGAGTAWNGSSCASICSGGQTWNGSACACPAGQVLDTGGTSCGFAPTFSAFSISPLSQYIGSSHTVNWGTTGSAPVGVSLLCSGANAAGFGLTPSTGGSGSLPVAAPGATNCIAQASSAWGTVSSPSASLNASCPPGTSWNGSTCGVASALVMTDKTVQLYAKAVQWAGAYTGLNQSTPTPNYGESLQVWGGAAGIQVGNKSSTFARCVITTVGVPCRFTSYYPTTYASSMFDQFDAGIAASTMWPANKYGFEFVTEALLAADGSITVWFFTSNQCIGAHGSSCLGSPYSHEAYAFKTTIPASVYSGLAAGGTAIHYVTTHVYMRAHSPPVVRF